MEPTKDEIIAGQWLARLLRQNGRLYEAEAVRAIKSQFGEGLLHRPSRGTWAISKGALKVFQQIVAPGFIWSKKDFGVSGGRQTASVLPRMIESIPCGRMGRIPAVMHHRQRSQALMTERRRHWGSRL